MKTTKIYTIAAGYASLTIWEARDETCRRFAQHFVTPLKQHTRRERYDIIAEKLKASGIPVPEFKPTGTA